MTKTSPRLRVATVPKGAQPRRHHRATSHTRPPGQASDGLSAQQRAAVAKVSAWFRGEEQVFRLFGYAGTGKTTIARHIVAELRVNAAYAAFTGKAAFVLRSKGCADASTLHSLIYLPKQAVRERIDQLRAALANESDTEARAALEQQVVIEERKVDNPGWILREPDECDLSSTRLLVVDEVSMVGERLALDLLSYGTKLLVLGDPAQLPPVDGDGYFIDADPDHLLTEIHRSALDSPVTRLATTVRNSALGERGYGVTGMDGDSGRAEHLPDSELAGFDQVLVGTNSTRWEVIRRIRALRGLAEPAPMPGDRIICLANSSDAEVFNGQQFTVQERLSTRNRKRSEDVDRWQLVVADDTHRVRKLEVWASGFRDIDGERDAKRRGRGSIAAATFAQAITTHKSQGSQWDSVLVIDESATFRRGEYRQHVKELGEAEATARAHRAGQRWLYTAATRAERRVVILPQHFREHP